MAYIINKTNGDQLTIVPDRTVETTSSSLNIVGSNFNRYGEIIAEDMIHMLENFTNLESPRSPLEGQLWNDTNPLNGLNNSLKIFVGDNGSNVTPWREIPHENNVFFHTVGEINNVPVMCICVRTTDNVSPYAEIIAIYSPADIEQGSWTQVPNIFQSTDQLFNPDSLLNPCFTTIKRGLTFTENENSIGEQPTVYIPSEVNSIQIITNNPYTLVSNNQNNTLSLNNSVSTDVIVPESSVTAFPVGTIIRFLQRGMGSIIPVAGTVNVSINNVNGHTGTSGMWAIAQIMQVETDVWILSGDTA